MTRALGLLLGLAAGGLGAPGLARAEGAAAAAPPGKRGAAPVAAPPAGASADPDHDGRRSREGREKLAEQVIDQMRALRMWKITEALKLDEATAAKLFPLLARFDEQARAIGRERHETMRELRDLMETPSPDQAKISGLVDRLVANQGRRAAFEEERTKAVRKVLTPVQQAKLLMVLPGIEEGFRRQIREAMGRGRFGEPPFGEPGERRGPAFSGFDRDGRGPRPALDGPGRPPPAPAGERRPR